MTKPLETIKNGQNSANQSKNVSPKPRQFEQGAKKTGPKILPERDFGPSKIVKIQDSGKSRKTVFLTDFGTRSRSGPGPDLAKPGNLAILGPLAGPRSGTLSDPF